MESGRFGRERSDRSLHLFQLGLIGQRRNHDSIVGIKFEGEPPFDLGVAQTVSAQVLDATVVLRVTVVVPEIRSKPVPVRFTMTAELARAFLEQFGTVVTMAELHKRQRPFS